MRRSINSPHTAEHSAEHMLAQTQTRIRWAVIAGLLLVTLAQPIYGRLGWPTWALVLVFAGYNLLRDRLTVPRSPASKAILDLPVVALIYFLGDLPSGPLGVLFLLITVCAVASMSLRDSLLYTAAVAATVVLIAPTLPLWYPAGGDVAELGARALVIGLTGVGANLVIRRLLTAQSATQQLETAAQQQQELERLRAKFLASVSHNLRTPLTAVRGSLGMLEASAAAQLPPEAQRLIENARRNVEQLNRMITDLLTFNQIEAGMLDLHCDPVDLRTVISRAADLVEPLMAQKGQTLQIDLPDPLFVFGDEQKLEQVVINLLAFFYVHTVSGTCITVAGKASEQVVRVMISDGTAAQIEQLRQTLQRRPDDHAFEDEPELGMIVARAVIELHHGQIAVEHHPDYGTRFAFEFPHAVQEQTSADDAQQLPSETPDYHGQGSEGQR